MSDFEEIHYSHQLTDNRCLFTGVSIDSKKCGEHVIPRWMVRDYCLQGVNVELGSKEASAKVSQFTAPAVTEENNKFGELENRIKMNQAAVSDDEMHLWLMKLMSGMLWNHCRLAVNVRHPNAPRPFDDRVEGILAREFRDGFLAWKQGEYCRKGSLVRLPSSVKTLFLAHTFGAVTNTAYSGTHDAILPLLMIIFGRPNHGLVVATFFDDERAFEAPDVLSKWNASKVKDETGSLAPRGALAIMFHELIVKPMHESLKAQVPEELILHLARTLGVEIKLDHAKGIVQFRDCTPEF